jgi:MSHA biogenesis protein MshP
MRRRPQRGMSLVVAIFLIVIIALLSAFAVSVGNATTQSTNQRLYADRAQAAAEAGLEWGAYNALALGACDGTPPYPVLNLAQGSLSGYRVEVQCVAHGGVFDITAFAQRGNFGQADYASRQLQRRFN